MDREPTHVWTVIPAHRPVLGLLQECLKVLDSDHVVVVANGEHQVTDLETHTHVLHDRKKDINISRWWNLGLDWIWDKETKRDGTVMPHHVLVLNADARIGPAGVAALSHALDQHPKAVMAGPMRGRGVHLETRPGPLGLDRRIPGYCFMLTSRHPIRLDERYNWWFSDDDLEWRARSNGGTLLVGPIEFRHLGDGVPRGHLLDLAKEDQWKFQAKWQTLPW